MKRDTYYVIECQNKFTGKAQITKIKAHGFVGALVKFKAKRLLNRLPYNMLFSWHWFVKGVKLLPKYNSVRSDVPKIFSTPMGTVRFSPFTHIVGRAKYECNFWLSLTISTRKQIQQMELLCTP